MSTKQSTSENIASCKNANNNNLSGITLNEGIDAQTGNTKSIFTFPNYHGCNGSRKLEINMSNDGKNVTITNSIPSTNIFGFNTNSIVSNSYEIIPNTLSNNYDLNYTIIISLAIIIIGVIYYFIRIK